MGQSGYWAASPWPAECGGNHRSKVANLPGPNLAPTDHLVATTRQTGRWNVMFVHRDPGQLYLSSTTLPGSPEVAGRVERVDPITMQTVTSSGDLPAGGHAWPGSVAVHQNGDLYAVNGSYLHRLDQDCQGVTELQLLVDHAHNGLLILDDGSILTKDVRVGDGADASTLTVCDPDLVVLSTAVVPEPSLGRPAAIGDSIYVPGSTRIFRYRWSGSDLELDAGWAPQYRRPDQGGVAGDLTIADGRVWFMNNADVPAIRRRLSPDGPQESIPASSAELSAPGWDTPVRALGIHLEDGSDVTTIAATELPSGWATAPPLVHDGILMTWDTGGMGMAAFDIGGSEAISEMLWFQPFRTSMRPLLFAATGELVVNDYRLFDDGTSSDDLVVLDLETGRMKARVPSGDTRMAGQFMTPSIDQAIYFCAVDVVTRVARG